MKNIIIFGTDEDKTLPDSELLCQVQKAIDISLQSENFDRKAEVSVTFCSNQTIHKLNHEHRNIDRETDVLSFPMLSEEDQFEYDYEKQAVMLGDIVISLDMAKSQAEEYGHSFEREIVFLTVHSMLHLLGYDHMQPCEEEIMFRKQNEILEILGIRR